MRSLQSILSNRSIQSSPDPSASAAPPVIGYLARLNLHQLLPGLQACLNADVGFGRLESLGQQCNQLLISFALNRRRLQPDDQTAIRSGVVA